MLQTYVPLYRKYRPQTFKDLVGQNAVAQTLSNAINNNKVAHAYLFTGPRGTGKTSAARILAKSLNCEKGPTPSPCGVCSSCVDITAGTALDVIEIDAASNRSVEDARDLIDKVQFASVSGKYKVYIIDEVHMLTPQAFNTLLKTLEEPPPNLVFVLATTEIHKVLDTIISRCQRFDFRRISQASIVERLHYIAELEKIDISKDALNLIARRSGGGLRDALGLLDQLGVLSSLGQQVGLKDVLNLIGALPEDMLIKLSEHIANREGANVLEVINELMSLGSEPLQMAKELTIHFRNLLIASTVKENLGEIIDASEEFYDDLKRIAADFKPAEIAQIIDKLAYTERMVRNATQPSLWLEVGLLSICYRQDIVLVEDLQRRIEELECVVASGSVPPEMTLSCERRASKPEFKPVEVKKPEVVKPQKPEQAPPKPEKKEMKPPVVEEKPAVKQVEKEEKVELAPVKQEISKPAVIPEPEVDNVPVVEEPVLELVPETVEEIVEEKPEEPIVASSDSESMPLESTWKAVLNAIHSPPTRGLLSSLAVPLAVSSDEIVIAFTQEFFVDDMNNPRKRKHLDEALEKVFGKVPDIHFKVLSEAEHKKIKAQQDLNAPAEEKKIVDEPIVPQPEKPQAKPSELPQVEKQMPQAPVEEGQVIKPPQEAVPEVEYSEQVKLVQDIFQGKILND